MKGWVRKDALMESYHSGSLRAWLKGHFNSFVPCDIQLGHKVTPPTGKVFIAVQGPLGTTSGVAVPIDAVMFEHRELRHSMPLMAYSEFKTFLEKAGWGVPTKRV